MDSLEVSEGKKSDPTSMPIGDSIIGMNLSSSQMKSIQSWGLGHSRHFRILKIQNFEFFSYHFGGFTWGSNVGVLF